MNTSAGLFQAFFETVQDVVLVIDADTRCIVHASAHALKATCYSLEDLVGMGIGHVLGDEGEARGSCVGDAGRSAGADLHPLRLVRKNDESVPVNVTASAFQCNAARYILLIVRRADPQPALASTLTPEREDFPTIIGQSTKIRSVCRRIGSLARSNVTVLIQGESGTGKEIIADAVHAHSHRSCGPLVKVNCAALTETLLESELFGHVKGAFTGAIRDRRGRFKQAEGGTIFLDEIGSLPLTGQAKLLRVLQERQFEPVGSSVTVSVDVRVIAATNTVLAKAVTEGRFREDLYYRLNGFLISLPPLRERKEDIVLLARHFLHRYAQTLGKRIQTMDAETVSLLVDHDWPGNVRELENAIEHAVIIEEGPTIKPASLPTNLDKAGSASMEGQRSGEPNMRNRLNTFEKQILVDALIRANGIRKRAAAMLGVDARNLPYLLRKHDLPVDFERMHAGDKLH